MTSQLIEILMYRSTNEFSFRSILQQTKRKIFAVHDRKENPKKENIL